MPSAANSEAGTKFNARKLLSVSVALTVLVLLLYAFLLAHKSSLVTADLGRHIKNGELFLQTLDPISTNFYSYTQPDFPTINHHWGSGVIFFVIWKTFGFAGLHLFFIIISLLTLFIFWRIAKSRAGPGIAALVFLLVLPLLGERLEIRPEVFSYLFSAIFLWLLLAFKEQKISARMLLFLPLIEIAWVNTHIYFVLGPLLIGAFLLESALVKKLRIKSFKKLLGIFTVTILAALISPFGLKGLIAPFTIFQNYGYRLIENQPIWFIQKLIPKPSLYVFELVFIVLVLSFIFVLMQRGKDSAREEQQQSLLANVFLAVGLGIMGWMALRNLAIFGFFALYLIAENMASAARPRIKRSVTTLEKGVLVVVLVVFFVVASGSAASLLATSGSFGLGFEPEDDAAAEFFKEQNIQGPIFNNYDIGGYLIFHLFPEHPVFVDNRPEGYSASFLQDTYIPMQEREITWQEQSDIYRFNSIFFYWHDSTPWGQRFIISRVQDPEWAPVFIDARSLILLKRNEINQSVIEQFEIPQEVFTTRSSS